MKALIMRLTQRISIESGGHTSVESLMFREYLLHREGFDEVYFCDKIVRNNADNYLDIFKTNLNDYDVVYLMNSPANFFGGVIKQDCLEKFKKISEYNGKLLYVLNDPKLYFVDVVKKAMEKKLVSEQLYNNFLERIKKMRVIFTGSNYELYKRYFINRSNFFDLEFEKNIPLFEFTFINYNFNKNVLSFNTEKNIDLVYYGDTRGGYRDKKLKQYFDNDILTTKTIGLKQDFKNNIKLDKVRNDLLSNEMQSCYGSLVIGDKEHNDNWITYRFFEGILAKIIIFIDIEYDPHKRYLDNPILKKLCYVSGPDDIKVKLQWIKENNYYEKVIELQTKELDKYNYLKIK